ncbi:MAG: hypothetical protein JWN04_5398 [Myxococcaceae bacterium]|nr:hypothetical protein [Myxococcaceae bacterium]
MVTVQEKNGTLGLRSSGIEVMQGIRNVEPSERRRLAHQASATVPELGPLVSSAASYARSARAERTLKEYAKQWATFNTWCAEHELCEVPAAPRLAMVQRYHRRSAQVGEAGEREVGNFGTGRGLARLAEIAAPDPECAAQ